MPDLGAIRASLEHEQVAVRRRSLSSPLYEALVTAALDDLDHQGPCAVVFASTPDGVELTRGRRRHFKGLDEPIRVHKVVRGA